MDMLDGMLRSGKTSALTAVEEMIAFDRKRLDESKAGKVLEEDSGFSPLLSSEKASDLDVLEMLFADDDFGEFKPDDHLNSELITHSPSCGRFTIGLFGI